MPADRQPLRKRRNVQLSVITCFSNKRKPPRKMAAKEEKPHRSSPVPSALPLLRPRKVHHLQSYCELVPFLSVALSDGLFDPITLLPPTTSTSVIPFTHFIRIRYSMPQLKPGLSWSEYHFNTGISVLNFIVPTPQPGQSERQRTLLSEHQLLLSRDFLSLALPYHCPYDPPTWADELSSADMVHVLITAPPSPFSGCVSSSSVVDVMAIVACYLTFVGGVKTKTVAKYVDSGVDAFAPELSDVWKGRIKGDGVEVIQRVAIASP